MTDAALDPVATARPQTPFQRVVSDFCESRLAVFGLFLVVISAFVALFAPWISPQNPFDIASLDLLDAKVPPGTVSSDGKMVYWLGTDGQARDMLSAIFYGMRISLFVGAVSVVLALAIGVVVGLVAAYAGGRVDALLMRIVDLMLSFPAILVALILLSVLGKGIDKVLFALILVQWAYFARAARGAALVERNKEYVEAATCLALPPGRIVFRHMLPNCMPSLIVIATITLARAIALEATLSFLGVGVPVTQPSLGMLISNGFEFLLSGAYWISFFPGVALAIAIVGINLAGDHLRDVLNPQKSQMSETGLQVRNLRTHFFTKEGVARAVDGVDFDVAPGEILGLVGESGSGKTVTGFSILGLIDPPGRIVEGSSIRFAGEELTTARPERLRAIRGAEIAMIFQDPMMTLNPVLRVDTQMIETVQAHLKVSESEARARSRAVLVQVGIASPDERLRAYPHQFSGGMRQRVAIAIALLHKPRLIVADEPTTALDVTIQGQILFEMQRLCRESNTALIWITHDLAVVAGLADRIAVMYAGRIVEMGRTADIIERPMHPYTKGLIGSVPSQNTRGHPLAQIPGMTPSLLKLPAGCAFKARCPIAIAQCNEMPALEAHRPAQFARCWRAAA